jgi:spermidine synthase
MLTAYLVGLSAGCLFASRFLLRYCSIRFLAALLLINGAAILAITPVIGFLPSWFVSVFGDMKAQWHMVMAKEFLTSASLMFIPTFIGGAIFPICLQIIAQVGERRTATTGVSTSIAYVWNTAGSIFGALSAGFVVIPLLGSERCLLIAASLSLAGSAVAACDETSPRPLGKTYACAIILMALAAPFLFTTWNATKMNSGVYVYSKFFDSENALEREMKNYDLIFYREGSASVAVLESAQGHRFLRVNGKTDGSSEGDNTTQMLLGYLPYLYAKETQNALVIGLGTGITSGCVLDLPVDSVESIEISPEVVEASRFFSALNQRVFEDQRSRLRILDGRTWLSAMPNTYDLIISEPSNPWQTGNANLFTADFFRIAGARLNEGGVLCQWIPYYNMDSSHFRLIIKSLQSVFPYVHLWMSGTDTFLISSMQPLEIKADRIRHLFEDSVVASKLKDMRIDTPSSLLSFYYLDSDSLQSMTRDVTSLNTDSFPFVEFHSPKFLLGPNRPDIFFEILETSYASSLEISDPALDSNARILHRRGFYSRWRIPANVTEEMLRRSLVD